MQTEAVIPGKTGWVHGYFANVDSDGRSVPYLRTSLTACATGHALIHHAIDRAVLVTGCLQGKGEPVAKGMSRIILQSKGIEKGRVIVSGSAVHTGTEVAAHLAIAKDQGFDRHRGVVIAFAQHIPTIELLHLRRTKRKPEALSVEELIGQYGTDEEQGLLAQLQASPAEASFDRYNKLVRKVMCLDSDYKLLGLIAKWTRRNVQASIYPGVLRYMFAEVDIPVPEGILLK